MGLDVLAYKNIKLVDEAEKYKLDLDEDGYPLSGNYIVLKKDVWGLFEGEDGLYSFEEPKYHFRAGSYSTYNYWRRILEEAAYEIFRRDNKEKVSDEYMKYVKLKETHILKFSKLIWFSDCDGVIDTENCKQLLQEFRDEMQFVFKYLKENFFEDKDNYNWFVDVYKCFIACFEVGANNGVVVFG